MNKRKETEGASSPSSPPDEAREQSHSTTLPIDRHGRMVGATLEHVGVCIDMYSLSALDDVDEVARYAFANRNGQGAPQKHRAKVKKTVRPLLRQAMRHAGNARLAILLGERDIGEEERQCAAERLQAANLRFLRPLARQAVEQSQQQKSKASKPRGHVESGETMADIVERIATSSELRGLTANELWTHLFAELDRLGLDPLPVEDGTDMRKWVYKYTFRGRRKPLTFGTFQDHVTAARKIKSD